MKKLALTLTSLMVLGSVNVCFAGDSAIQTVKAIAGGIAGAVVLHNPTMGASIAVNTNLTRSAETAVAMTMNAAFAGHPQIVTSETRGLNREIASASRAVVGGINAVSGVIGGASGVFNAAQSYVGSGASAAMGMVGSGASAALGMVGAGMGMLPAINMNTLTSLTSSVALPASLTNTINLVKPMVSSLTPAIQTVALASAAMMPVVGLPVAGALMISKSPSLMSEITAPLTTPFQQASSVSGSLLTWLVTGKMPVQNMPTINLAMGQSTRSNMNIPVNINFGTPAMIGGNKIFLVKPIGH